MFAHHRCPLLLLIGFAVGATDMALPDSACADSIFVPGATLVRVTFGAVVSRVQGEIPAIPAGTLVSGQFVYDLDVIDPATGASPIAEFLMTAGDITFTDADVLESRVNEFVGTFGFDAQASLRGRPELGDLSDGVLFEVFAEFEDFNFFLSGVTTDASAFGGLTSLQFENASPATPEPPTFFMVSLLPSVLAIHLRKQAREKCRHLLARYSAREPADGNQPDPAPIPVIGSRLVIPAATTHQEHF